MSAPKLYAVARAGVVIGIIRLCEPHAASAREGCRTFADPKPELRRARNRLLRGAERGPGTCAECALLAGRPVGARGVDLPAPMPARECEREGAWS